MTKLPASRLRDISIDASVLCKESPPAKLYILNHIERFCFETSFCLRGFTLFSDDLPISLFSLP